MELILPIISIRRSMQNSGVEATMKTCAGDTEAVALQNAEALSEDAGRGSIMTGPDNIALVVRTQMAEPRKCSDRRWRR